MKRRDEIGFLDIFQDPLITIIALVLLSSIWMIFPGESKSVNPEVYKTLDDIDVLKREIQSMREKIAELEMEVQTRKEEVKWLQGIAGKAKVDKETYSNDVAKLKQKIAELRSLIKKRQKDLEKLRAQLRGTNGKLAESNKIEHEIERIVTKIKMLREEIEEKTEQLRILEEKIKQAIKELEEVQGRKKDQEKLIARLQNKLKQILEEIKALEEKQKKKMGGGFTQTFKSEKEPFHVELINNRLFPVDDDHYEVEYGYLKIEDGSTVEASKKTRKSHLTGEGIDEIAESASDFCKVLDGLNSEKMRLIFLLHDDSFEIFRKAREIALNKNFEIGWWPYELDAIILVGSKDGDGIDSTNRPKRP